jgi:hypothetical protein
MEETDLQLRILLSYHYYRDVNLRELFGEYFEEPWPDIFLDSGAFSAHTQGAPITAEDYAEWLREVVHVADLYCTLDVIGDAEGTAENTEKLRNLGFDPLPVFHVASPMSRLEELAGENEYIGLGAMIEHRRYGSNSREHLLAWLARCFTVTERYGTKVHGFGLTDLDIMRDFPFRSSDSVCWKQGNIFGKLLLFAPRGDRFLHVNIRNRKHLFHNRKLLKQHGITASELRDYDGQEPLYSQLSFAGLKSLFFAQQNIRERAGRAEFQVFAVAGARRDFNLISAADTPVEEWSYERCAAG